MKIESVKVNFAVADRISRKNILEMMSEMVLTPESNKLGFYGIEIEEDGKGAADVPSKKRKYTRRKMSDGTTIENRGNCQGGGAV